MLNLETNKTVSGRLRLRHARLVHGGPTTGKTTLLSRLNKDGVIGVDSDRLSELVFGTPNTGSADEGAFWWWVAKSHKGDKLAEAVVNANNTGAHFATLDLLRRTENGFLLSNLLASDAPKFYGIPPCVSFFRSPRAMVELSVQRVKQGKQAHPFPLKLVQKWYDGWAKAPADRFTKRFVLEDGEYLDTVLDVEINAFRVTEDSPFLSNLLKYQLDCSAFERKRDGDAS